MRTRIIAIAGILTLSGAATAQIRGGAVHDGKRIGMGTVEKSREQILREKQRAYQSAIRRARENINSEHWGEARECVDIAMAEVTSPQQLEEIKSLLLKLQSAGDSQLKEAEALYENEKYKEALRSYRRVAYQFGDLPCARRARELIRSAADDPKVKAAGKEVRAGLIDDAIETILSAVPWATTRPASRRARRGGADADERSPGLSDDQHDSVAKAPRGRAERIKRLEGEDQARVMDMLLRIVKYYPDTPTGQRAKKDIDALRADKAFMTRLARARMARDARKALARADSYRKAGMHEKAVLLYKQVVEKFPGTPQADEALARIAAPPPAP